MKVVNDIAGLLNILDILKKRPLRDIRRTAAKNGLCESFDTQPVHNLGDEPTGNLDSKSSREVMESMKILNEEKSATIMMVTHDPFAASFCHRIVMIKDGQFFLEIVKGGNRQAFFQEILDSLSLLGGNYNDIA